MIRWLLALAVVLSAWLTAGGAAAQLRIEPLQVVLSEGSDGRFEGSVELRNDGDAPLVITQIDAPHLARGVGIDPGSGPHTIGSGQTLAVRILWLSRRSRARQLEGHVEVSVEGAPAQAIAIHASRGHRHHLPGMAIVLGVMAAALAGLGRRKEAFVVQALALVALVVVAIGFIPGVTSAEGNFGFQWVYRRALFGGASWYVALDGFSLPLVLAGAALPFGAATREELGRGAAGVAVHLLGAAVVGAVLSLDVRVQLFFWLVAWAASAALLAAVGALRAAVAVALFGVVGGALTAYGLGAFHALAPSGFGADGQAIAHLGNYPAWSEIDWLKQAEPGALKTAWVTTFLGFGLGVPILGGHLAWSEAERRHRSASGIALGGLGLIGLIGWLRLWAIAPALSLWASPSLVWLGVAMTIVGGVLVMHERVAIGSHLTTGGIALGALASATPQGMESAVIAGFGAGVATAWRVASPSRWSRAAAVGAPGSVLFWGPVLGITALGARHPMAAILIALGWGLALVGATRRRDDDAPAPLPGVIFATVVLVFGLWPAGLLRAVDAKALEVHRRLDPAGPTQIAHRTTPLPVACRVVP